jgi:hypothetical protein
VFRSHVSPTWASQLAYLFQGHANQMCLKAEGKVGMMRSQRRVCRPDSRKSMQFGSVCVRVCITSTAPRVEYLQMGIPPHLACTVRLTLPYLPLRFCSVRVPAALFWFRRAFLQISFCSWIRVQLQQHARQKWLPAASRHPRLKREETTGTSFLEHINPG